MEFQDKLAKNHALYFDREGLQTGPARRQDKKIVAAHLELLEEATNKEIYTLLEISSLTKPSHPPRHRVIDSHDFVYNSLVKR